MNRDDDFISELEDYLDTFDGVVPLPAHVRDAVHGRLPKTRQVHGPGGPERMLTMTSRLSSSMRWVIGAAAVLAIFVVGVSLLGNGQTGPAAAAVTSPAATSPSAVPPATPIPSASHSGQAGPTRLARSSNSAPCGGGAGPWCLTAGTYALSSESLPATVTFDVPTGWFSWTAADDFEGVLVENEDAQEGSGWGVMFSQVSSVSKDPCDTTAGQFDTAETATVDGLVAAMRSWPGFEVSTKGPIDVGGYAGQLIEVRSTQDSDTCPVGVIWATPSGIRVDAYPMVGKPGDPRPAQFRILDVGGRVLVIRTTEFPDPSPFELEHGVKADSKPHVEDLPVLQAIVDSIRIGT